MTHATRLRLLLATAASAALVLGACFGGDDMHSRNQAANDLFYAGEFDAALEEYQEMLAERPNLPELAYNTGNTLHRFGAFDQAVSETQRALPPTDVQLGATTYYALGNHLLALDRLEEAYAAYRNALLLDPDDQDAKHNLEVTLLLIQHRDTPEDEPLPPGPMPDRSTGQDDGSDDQPQNAQPTPGTNGENGDDGEDGENGEPQPGDQAPAGDPGEGEPGDPSDSEPGGDSQPGEMDPEALQRALEEALAGIEDELTYEQALEILDLLRRQQQSFPFGHPAQGPEY